MCMMFRKPSNIAIPDTYFKSLWDSNPDGISIIEIESGVIHKTKDKASARLLLDEMVKRDCFIHFRLGTSGNSTMDQLHGWPVVNGRYNFFHNGVLRTFRGNDQKSDTQQLVDMFNDGSFTLEAIVAYLEEFEQGSRFTLYDRETKELITPDCAEWHTAKLPCGNDICWSNTYAIDAELIGLQSLYSKGWSNKSFGGSSSYYDWNDIDDEVVHFDDTPRVSKLSDPDYMEYSILVESLSNDNFDEFQRTVAQCNSKVLALLLKELWSQ